MSRPYLSIGRLERRLSDGGMEFLQFEQGVNLLVGRPNTGKTKWLQTLDFLLGDPGENPFEGAQEEGLAEKYCSASVEIQIGEKCFKVERRWREPGSKTKVFVDDEALTVREFQQFLLGELKIPLLNFPKGNPMSGQTWPELSFRMLLRHIFRQQRFWSGIADQQPEGEQHACLLQFLGIAERLFSEEYGQLIRLQMEADRLKWGREQYGNTLDELARGVLSEPGLNITVSEITVGSASTSLSREIEDLRQRRVELISGKRDQAIPSEHRNRTDSLMKERAAIVVMLERLRSKEESTIKRLTEVKAYRAGLGDELDRMARAEDAGAVLADIRITHCPACDQPVVDKDRTPAQCFLCHQDLDEKLVVEGLGTVRLRFENDRLSGEFKEADELVGMLQREVSNVVKELASVEERFKMLENELAPIRQAMAALIQDEISAIDMKLGELNERQRQLGRVSAALAVGRELTDQIAIIEQKIEPLRIRLNETIRGTDFDAAAMQLEQGMNAYLSAINILKPGVWQHSGVTIDILRSSFTIRVGRRRWHTALGGTDTLYFLMAYQYGLLTLSNKPENHYSGMSIIDLPGEFLGEAIEDKENFIIQPFIDLLGQDEYQGTQVIITGVSFTGLDGVNRIPLTNVYTA